MPTQRASASRPAPSLGINLGVTHNYSTTSGQLFILYYRNSSTVTICGDTNYPALAKKPRI